MVVAHEKPVNGGVLTFKFCGVENHLPIIATVLRTHELVAAAINDLCVLGVRADPRVPFGARFVGGHRSFEIKATVGAAVDVTVLLGGEHDFGVARVDDGFKAVAPCHMVPHTVNEQVASGVVRTKKHLMFFGLCNAHAKHVGGSDTGIAGKPGEAVVETHRNASIVPRPKCRCIGVIDQVMGIVVHLVLFNRGKIQASIGADVHGLHVGHCHFLWVGWMEDKRAS